MTTTPQAALLSDDEIERHFEINRSAPGRELRRLIGRSIEADVLAKLQATQAEPVQAGELPDEREAFEATVLKDNPHAVLTKSRNWCYQDDELQAMWWAWQARAALSARKPLPYDLICNAIDLADTESMKGDYVLDSGDCIAVVRTMQALIEINGIGLEVKP